MVSAFTLWSWLSCVASHFDSVMAAVATQPDSSPSAAAISYGNSTGEPGAAPSTDNEYTKWTISAIQALQMWYDQDEGLWNSTNWWNAANCLTVLGDFVALGGDRPHDLDLANVFSNTFIQAQRPSKTTNKKLMARQGGSRTIEPRRRSNSKLVDRGYRGFLDGYYDDEGWWALAWIRAYDVIGNAEYLFMAESIFHDMQGGLANSTCGGGIWWDKDRTYKNAIANELFLSVAAHLANRASHADAYLAVAKRQWAWFQRSGMINNENLVNDGLKIYTNGTCANNGLNTWSYNQGVILGGLVELYKATGDYSLLSKAANIAEAAISALSKDGILHESCENDDCGADGSQFKGTSSGCA